MNNLEGYFSSVDKRVDTDHQEVSDQSHGQGLDESHKTGNFNAHDEHLESNKQTCSNIIDKTTYIPGSFIRILTVIITILFVPLQLFCDGLVKSKEQSMIKDI